MCKKYVSWLHIYCCTPIPFRRKYVCFDPQQNYEVEDCDAVPDAGTSMWATRVLSIFVKNTQSYVVAVVWGVAEVLSLCRGKGEKSSTYKKGAPIEGESSLISSASVAPDD